MHILLKYAHHLYAIQVYTGVLTRTWVTAERNTYSGVSPRKPQLSVQLQLCAEFNFTRRYSKAAVETSPLWCTRNHTFHLRSKILTVEYLDASLTGDAERQPKLYNDSTKPRRKQSTERGYTIGLSTRCFRWQRPISRRDSSFPEEQAIRMGCRLNQSQSPQR